MEFKGLKKGTYVPDLDIFVSHDDPRSDHIIGSCVDIQDNVITAAEYGRKFPYHFDLNMPWALVRSIGIPKNATIEYVENLILKNTIIFGDSYKDYLINTINHIIESHKSDTEEYQTELNISRFLIKEMKKLIAYKEDIHGKSQLNTDIIKSGLSSHPCKKAIQSILSQESGQCLNNFFI